jgi:hypothetical protein
MARYGPDLVRPAITFRAPTIFRAGDGRPAAVDRAVVT